MYSSLKILFSVILLGLSSVGWAQSIIIPQDKQLHMWAGFTTASITHYLCKTYIIPNDEKKTLIATITVSSLAALGKEIYDYKTNPNWSIDDSQSDFLCTIFGAGITIVVIKWEF